MGAFRASPFVRYWAGQGWFMLCAVLPLITCRLARSRRVAFRQSTIEARDSKEASQPSDQAIATQASICSLSYLTGQESGAQRLIIRPDEPTSCLAAAFDALGMGARAGAFATASYTISWGTTENAEL